jgi:opacity protein-like surface antigen
MNLIFKIPISAALSAAIFVGASAAHDWYAGGSVAWMQQSDSDNSGQFTSDFTTGEGGTVAAGTVLPAGTDLGWETGFDNSYAVSGEVGARFHNGLRGALEVSFSEADVDDHKNLSAAGIALDGEDVAVLTGSATTTGSTVGQVLANGRGQIQNTAVYANAYYDFDLGYAVKPYIGAGVGVSNVEVEYNPSGVGVTKDSSVKLAGQLKAGATYQVTNQWEVFGEYTYRTTEDVKVDLDLVPGNLRVENEQQMVGIGLRYRFGS